ncbi:MAG: hypothetical protein IKB16_07675 [Lentisphaeria bacterium]|nr:hypothetical protein [Lentisphaeria bacterium]
MKKSRLILIILSLLILLVCVGVTVYLLFSNYQNVRLFKEAQRNFQRGDEASLSLAEEQLLQVVRNDSDNEAAFVMLGEIARKRKIYPEQVYYCYMAYRLNPLSDDNRERYINSLCFARYFDRLETFLAQEDSLNSKYQPILLYAAGRNGNINSYKQQMQKWGDDNRLGTLSSLLFNQTQLSPEEKLAAIDKLQIDDNIFLQQEVSVARTELYFSMQNIDTAEKFLLQAYNANEYAFAPALGRFYANYRSLGKALKIFEKHLSIYHDHTVAIQCAEIYCLLNQKNKIADLQKAYQSDSGHRAMLCDYYLRAMLALLEKDTAALKELTAPLRKNINTPFAAFLFFCTDIQHGDLQTVQDSYNALLAHRDFAALQEQADDILLNFLKRSFTGNSNQNRQKLLSLASQLYERKKDVSLVKLILLAQKSTNSINPVLLDDAVKRFGNDQGILKLAIEYALSSDIAEAEKLIARYKQQFVSQGNDTLRYEINLNIKKGDFDQVSKLFQKNFSQEILPEYWAFASTMKRESDLLFLSKDKLYEPYCKALLLLNSGKNEQAVAILKNADANNNPALLFFAAKVLAENGHNQAALKKYEQIPDTSPLKLTVLLNTAEIYAELGDLDRALSLSHRAYSLAPQMPETQLCYADKLHKKGKSSMIPEVIKLSPHTPLPRKMESLWIIGMQQCITECDINTQQEKIRDLCRKLLVISPDNSIALEYLRKLH